MQFAEHFFVAAGGVPVGELGEVRVGLIEEVVMVHGGEVYLKGLSKISARTRVGRP